MNTAGHESRTYRTCTEHEHCQEEIVESIFDSIVNSYVVVHHRNAQEQPRSPRAPEGGFPILATHVLEIKTAVGSRKSLRAYRKALRKEQKGDA